MTPPQSNVVEVSVAVMAHKRRTEMVDQLLEQLGVPTEVVWDTDNVVWNTRARATLSFPSEATHHLVLQDDALVCKNLVPALTRALRYSGDHPVSLYMGRRPSTWLMRLRLRHAVQNNSPWIRMPGPVWGVGVVLPVSLATQVVEWGNTHPFTQADDLRMTRFFQQEMGVDCWYTLPSLVDHRVGVSILKGPGVGPRQALDFIRDRPTSTIDWSQIPPEPPQEGYMTLGQSLLVCWDCGYKTVTARQMEEHRRRRHRARTGVVHAR